MPVETIPHEMTPPERAATRRAFSTEEFNSVEPLMDHFMKAGRLREVARSTKAPGDVSAYEAQRHVVAEALTEHVRSLGYEGSETFKPDDLFGDKGKELVKNAESGSLYAKLREVNRTIADGGSKMMTGTLEKNGESVSRVAESGGINEDSAPKTTKEVYEKLPDKSRLLQFLKLAGLFAAGVWALDQIADALSGCYQIDIKGGMKTAKLCKSAGPDVCNCDGARNSSLRNACHADVPPCWDNPDSEKAKDYGSQSYDYVYQKKSIGDVLADTATFVKDAASMVPQNASSIMNILKWGAIAAAVVVGIVVVLRVFSELNRLTTARRDFTDPRRRSRRRRYTGLGSSGLDRRMLVSLPWTDVDRSRRRPRSEGEW